MHTLLPRLGHCVEAHGHVLQSPVGEADVERGTHSDGHEPSQLLLQRHTRAPGFASTFDGEADSYGEEELREVVSGDDQQRKAIALKC